MKKILLITLLITSTHLFSQSTVGVMGGYNFTMEKEVVGVMVSKKIPRLEEIQVGMGYMAPLDNFGKGTSMVNYQVEIFELGLGGGIGIPLMENQKVFPFLLVTYKPFRRNPMKLFLNSTEKRQVIGISYPIFKVNR